MKTIIAIMILGTLLACDPHINCKPAEYQIQSTQSLCDLESPDAGKECETIITIIDRGH